MFSCFQSSYTKEKIDNSGSQLWWDMLIQIDSVTPDKYIFKKPDKGISHYCYKIVIHKAFEVFIILVILINLVSMAIAHEASTLIYDEVLEIVGLICTFVFILEAFIKIFAFGLYEYFKDAWNLFDFIVVCTGIVDIGISASSLSLSIFRIFQVMRMFKIIRVARYLLIFSSLGYLNLGRT